MSERNLEHQRAAYVWGAVQGCSDEYAKLAKAAPALIMNSGLMQTLAYYQEKGKKHHEILLEHIGQWLQQQFDWIPGNNFSQLMTALHGAAPRQYRDATEETLALLRWIRQFAAVAKAG